MRPTGQILLPAVHKFRSKKLAVIVNLFPVLHFHRRKVNAGLSLFTLKWQGKSLQVNSIECFEVVRVCLIVCGRGAVMAGNPVFLSPYN